MWLEVVVRHVRDENGNLRPLRVSELGKVLLEDRDIRHLVRVDGMEGVGLSLHKEAGANTVAVSRAARAALSRLQGDLPGVETRIASDEAALVEDAMADVQQAALLGIALAVLVLVFFLRSPGPVIAVAVSLPVSLLAALCALYLGGQTLNLMTLGGLALGVGLLVDNAIVVVESIYRHRGPGVSTREAVIQGTGAVGGAIVASTLTTCVVFLPVLFVRGLCRTVGLGAGVFGGGVAPGIASGGGLLDPGVGPLAPARG